MTKKQLIIDAALELFAEKGIEATSVQQITALCGISKGAFYLSFKSKDELILAIIEHFMNTIIQKVDQAVTNTPDRLEKLTVYFTQSFTLLSEYTGFAEILMREKVSTISENLIEKLQYYVALSNENLVKLLFDVFGEQIEGKQFDLVIIINGMVQSYLQWLFELRQPADIQKLVASLVEKTTILATQSKLIFLEQTTFSRKACTMLPIEKIVEELQQMSSDAVNSVQKESITLLVEELAAPIPRPAILYGLIANLEQNEKFSWYCYLLKKQLAM